MTALGDHAPDEMPDSFNVAQFVADLTDTETVKGSVEICDACGITRTRALFYDAHDCHEEGAFHLGHFIPGPSRGAHDFVFVDADDFARGLV